MEEIEQEVLDLLQRKTDNTDELTVRFRNAVMLERVKKKLLGIPVARHDKEKRSAYLEYLDGKHAAGLKDFSFRHFSDEQHM